MKFSRVAGILMLTMALTPGCAWDQSFMAPSSSPSPTVLVEPSALESKLDAMDNRLERIEQMLTDIRDQEQQRQEEQSRQSLAGLRQEARNTQAALTRLEKQLATQHAAVVAHLGKTPANQVDFRAVDIPMGQLPNGGQRLRSAPDSRPGTEQGAGNFDLCPGSDRLCQGRSASLSDCGAGRGCPGSGILSVRGRSAAAELGL